jgi:uncharacterized membrane protein YfcA
MEIIAKYIVILFGIFFIGIGILMVVNPEKARNILRKAGSTNFINYSEITLRMIPAAALIVYADFSKYPEVFRVFGWFMLATSFVLYFVPRRLHHKFSLMSADILKPAYVRLLSPFASFIGCAIIYSVV